MNNPGYTNQAAIAMGGIGAGGVKAGAKGMAKEAVEESVTIATGIPIVPRPKVRAPDAGTISKRSARRSTVQANRQAAKTDEAFLRDSFGGEMNVSRNTPFGRRELDNLASGIGREAKHGRTSLTKRIRRQIAKDKALLRNSETDIEDVEWHFFPGKTGKGPTGPLRRRLEKAGIDVIVH